MKHSNDRSHVCFSQCDSCGTKDWSLFTKYVISATGDCFAYCNRCRSGKVSAIPDVWYGYGSGVHTEENIADPKTGEPIPFWDKKSKAAAMKRAGVMEAGDRYHGARSEDRNRKIYI